MRYYVKVSNLDGTHERYGDGSFGTMADAEKVALGWMEWGYRAIVESDDSSPATVRAERLERLASELEAARARRRGLEVGTIVEDTSWGQEEEIRFAQSEVGRLGRMEIDIRNGRI